MAMISAFLDESGKFEDRSSISLAAVAGSQGDFTALGNCWRQQLLLNGLKMLTMKEALNARRPLSEKNPSLGVEERIKALLPFALCIRKHVQNVVGFAVDVEAFKSTPSHLRQVWGDDPIFLAFARTLVAIMEPLAPEDFISIICDDEEKVALPMYKLYRRIKIVYKDARRRLGSLSFADDEHLMALQAADFIASLLRLESDRTFRGTDYDYRVLWEIFKTREGTDRLWGFGGAFVDADTLKRISEGELARHEAAKRAGYNYALIDADS